jgi:hypothetical protein
LMAQRGVFSNVLVFKDYYLQFYFDFDKFIRDFY